MVINIDDRFIIDIDKVSAVVPETSSIIVGSKWINIDDIVVMKAIIKALKEDTLVLQQQRVCRAHNNSWLVAAEKLSGVIEEREGVGAH